MSKLLFPLTAAIFLTGCAAYRTPTSAYLPSGKNPYFEIRKNFAENKIYDIIPRKREQIEWYDMPHWISWNVAGNDDDGIFGENAGTPYSTNVNFNTFCTWTARNPMHNLFFYTLGSAEAEKHSNFKVMNLGNKNLEFLSGKKGKADNGRFNFEFSFNDYKPFLRFRFGIGEAYIGWRERGNFGFALRAIH